MATSAPARGLTRHLLEAGFKFAAARLRSLGTLTTGTDWEARASVCERCHIRVVRCGISYCGKPFLQQIERDPATEGCGCKCRDKAKDPHEHCPINEHYQPAEKHGRECTCRWCSLKVVQVTVGGR